MCGVVREVAFRSEKDTVRAVWTHPDGPSTGARPAFILCPDCALTQEIGLPGVARWLQSAGYGSLRIDYRGWGGSEGTPRGAVDPERQVEDVRAAVTFLHLQREIDTAHVGVAGWGLGGGVALQAAALDGRIGAVLAVDPVGDGERWLASLHGLAIWRRWQTRLAQDRLNRSRTGYSEYVPAIGARPEAPRDPLGDPLFPVGAAAAAWLDAQSSGTMAMRAPRFVPLQSADRIAAFRPERFLDLLAGRGICIVSHAEDSLVGPVEALACARALRGGTLRLAPAGVIRDRHELWAPTTLAWLARQVSAWLVRWLPIANGLWQSPSALTAAPPSTAPWAAAGMPSGGIDAADSPTATQEVAAAVPPPTDNGRDAAAPRDASDTPPTETGAPDAETAGTNDRRTVPADGDAPPATTPNPDEPLFVGVAGEGGADGGSAPRSPTPQDAASTPWRRVEPA